MAFVQFVDFASAPPPPSGVAYVRAFVRLISGANPYPPTSDLGDRWDFVITEASDPNRWAFMIVEAVNDSASPAVVDIAPMTTVIRPLQSQPFGVINTDATEALGVTALSIPDWDYNVTPPSLANTFPDGAAPSYNLTVVLYRDTLSAPNGVHVELDPGGVFRAYWFATHNTYDVDGFANFYSLLLQPGNGFDVTLSSGPPPVTEFWMSFVGSREEP